MGNSRSSIRAVLFDLDDILNDRPLSWLAYVRDLANPESGLLAPCDEKQILRAILTADQGGYRPKRELFDELYNSLPWETSVTPKQLEQHWRNHFCRSIVIREHVIDTLCTLRKLNLQLGIVSNGQSDFQNAKIDAMAVRHFFDIIVISESLGFKKPDRRIFEFALNALKIAPEETLFVGDNPMLDIQGASQLGLRTAWLNTGDVYPVNIPRPDYEFRNFSEFFSMIGLARTIRSDL